MRPHLAIAPLAILLVLIGPKPQAPEVAVRAPAKHTQARDSATAKLAPLNQVALVSASIER